MLSAFTAVNKISAYLSPPVKCRSGGNKWRCRKKEAEICLWSGYFCCREGNLEQVGYHNALSLPTLKIISNTNQNTRVSPGMSLPLRAELSVERKAVPLKKNQQVHFSSALFICLLLPSSLWISHRQLTENPKLTQITAIFLTWIRVKSF